MVKFLKRSLAIFLSISTLFFKGPVCFGEEPPKGGGVPLSLAGSSDFHPNPTYGAAGGANPMYGAAGGPGGGSTTGPSGNPGDVALSISDSDSDPHHQPVAGKAVTLLPKSDSDDDAMVRRYAARKVQTADVGVSLHREDNSYITVPTVDFFTCPPKTAKELFERQDKEAAIAFQDGALHTNAIDRIEADKCCCKRCCGCPQCGHGFARVLMPSLFLLGGLSSLIFYGEQYSKLREMSVPPPEYDSSSEIKRWEEDREVTMFVDRIVLIISVAYTLLAAAVLYSVSSKACCGCYACKPSNYGCSCGYGCCHDGDKCVGCIGCCDDKCSKECLTCCSCDNGGLAIDWCGNYGSGGCCTGPMYDDKDDFIVSVTFFENFIKSLGGISKVEIFNPKGTPAEIFEAFKKYLFEPELTFTRIKDGCKMGIAGWGNSDVLAKSGVMEVGLLPRTAEYILRLFGSDGSGVRDDKSGKLDPVLDDFRSKFPFMTEIELTNSTNISEFVNRLNLFIVNQLGIQGIDSLAEKFIRVTWKLCEYALHGKSLSPSEQIRLQNGFNFLRALCSKY